MASISDVMKRDHQTIRNIYQNIVQAQDEDTAARWANQVFIFSDRRAGTSL